MSRRRPAALLLAVLLLTVGCAPHEPSALPPGPGRLEVALPLLDRLPEEQRDWVVQKHAAGRAINAQNVVRDTGTEFHPGAVRYYREIGIWPEREAAN